MSSLRAIIESRRCTMICATILLCYLFTCCTHLVTLAQSQQQDTQQLPVVATNGADKLAADRGGGNGGFAAATGNGASSSSGSSWSSINWDNKDDIRMEDLKHDNVHRLMSEQDLRRTFQVDSHDQVPEYEILKLTVNDDGSHLISPISDLGELTTTLTKTTTKTTTTTKLNESPKNSPGGGLRQRRQDSNHHTNKESTTSARSNQEEEEEEEEANGDSDHQSPSTHSSASNPNSRPEELATTLKTSQQAPVRHKRSPSLEGSSLGLGRSGEKENESSSPRMSDGPRTTGAKLQSSDRAADAKAAANGLGRDGEGTGGIETGNNNDHEDNKLIVMNLSTFGKDFKLRLKRNVDFQQRIKDMKMFMAESTKDGQLRYTEIKSHSANQQQQQHHHQDQRKQEPHKREADATAAGNGEPIGVAGTGGGDTIDATILSPSSMSSSLSSSSSPAATKESGGSRQQAAAKKKLNQNDEPTSSSAAAAANVWNIGSTYHDEDNLAALLIDHDRKTGQLQVDGTIGNDFVIKPMPQATIDALLSKRKQDLLRRQQQLASTLATEQLASTSRLDRLAPVTSSTHNAIGVGQPTGQPLDLERSSKANTNLQGSSSSAVAKQLPLPIDTSAIHHMHDDDPHDDDEMFLDEDEALELAHLQSTASIESNHTTGASANQNQSSVSGQHQLRSNPASPLSQLPQKQQQQQQPPPRTLSKAASERKWKKYRKLMAQTQVPKPGQLAERQQQLPPVEMRARRHTGDEPIEDQLEPRAIQVSHHIIYRQKPSSEGSSSEHQHSFMVSPGDYMNSPASAASMERLAVSFSSQRLAKRSASDGEGQQHNMIDSTISRTQAADQFEDADFLHDPLGGQFYLEPGSVTGFERAGYSDWSLMGRAIGGRGAMAPPPYALNRTTTDGQPSARMANQSQPYGTGNGTVHGRYKRQAPHRMGPMSAQVRRKRQAPDTVWPEVLLVVDYDSFLLHGGDSRDVKRYFVSFWNGVDLRYKLLVHPHIRISLAGMIVAKDRDATPYLERNRLRAPNADAVDAAGALTDMGKYLYREDRLPTYDLAVVITKLDMCRRRYEGGRCNRGTAGFAYVGGACVVNKRLEKVNSVAIIEDSGGFSGIIVAAHEVGHLLGCVHDGSPPPTYLGGPGATHCPWEDGFIMSDLRHTERGFRWSQCSVEQFKHFLNGETATCLYNYPHESQMLHRLLPGTMLSLDEQCKRDRGTNACFKDARVCAQLFCFDSASGYCVSYRPAAEGSPCGEGQVCRNGKCVGEIENIIPDYTHQTQTVVARGRSHPVSRLADNGLSASSTSTATSSPDSKLAPNVATIPQLTSRMDTFPVDTPISGTGTYSAHPFGGRYSLSSSSSSSSSYGGGVTVPILPGTTSIQNHNSHHAPMKSANLIDFGTSNLNFNNNNHNRRNGQQAVPKVAGAITNQNNAAMKPYGSYQSNLNNNKNHHHGGSTNSALYTSASTMSHQAASASPSSSYSSSTNGGNNLLTTSVTTNQLTKAKNKQQQQLHDNQRILYQAMPEESHYNTNNNNQNVYVNSNNNNYNRNVNHHKPSSSSSYLSGSNTQSTSHRLYHSSSFPPQPSVTS